MALDPIPTTTTWNGSSGDWFQADRWSAGVPSEATQARIPSGNVSFDSDAFALDLVIGNPVWSGTSATASVVGTASLSTSGFCAIGYALAPGSGNTTVAVGELIITDGDLTIVRDSATPPELEPLLLLQVGNAWGSGSGTQRIAQGNLQLTNGTITTSSFEVGSVGGTGTLTRHQATGNVSLDHASIVAGDLGIGLAGGTGSAAGVARGSMTVEHGDIHLEEMGLDGSGVLRIGMSGGTGNYTGDAEGLLTLKDGSITSQQIVVGFTGPVDEATGAARGRLVVDRGNVLAEDFMLATQSGNGGPVEGVFEQYRGTTLVDSFTQGSEGRVVLGIGGAAVGEGYSQIEVDTAILNGMVEARFVDGYLPRPGDVYDLIVGNSIGGNYDVTITGIDPAAFLDLQWEMGPTYLRLSVRVPEPSSYLSLASAIMGLTLLRWRGTVKEKKGEF